MAHQFVANRVHVIFATKNRQHVIPSDMQNTLWRYTAGIANNIGLVSIAVNGFDDHMHLLFGLPAKLALAEAVQNLKANSSRWIREHGIDFRWQEGYGAFAVSTSQVRRVAKYIETQPDHHQRLSFEDEFRAFLKVNGFEYDPRMWADSVPS